MSPNKKYETVTDIVAAFRKVHGDKYNYSLVTAWNNDWHTKIKIICNNIEDHQNHKKGYIFPQTPASHFYNKNGCNKCGDAQKSLKQLKSQEVYIAQVAAVHGDSYDYSETVYKGDQKYLTIICHDHGEFSQRADHHLSGSGCTDCRDERFAEERAYSFEDFFNIANDMHLGKYKYLKKTWKGYDELITIICPDHKHGEFDQVARYHARGSGCTNCKQSKGEREVERFLISHNIKFLKQAKFKDCKDKRELPFDFWIPSLNALIEYDGEQHHRERKEGIFKGKFEIIKRRDKIKNEFCKNQNIHLLRIKYQKKKSHFKDIKVELNNFLASLK